MKAATPFKDQVSDWFLTMGFECREYQADHIHSMLHISKEGKLRLSLILVEVKDWLSTRALESWPECIQYVTKARKNGIVTIVLWEDFWVNKQNIVQSRLAAMLGIAHKIPARLTQVRRIDKKTADQFLSENHLNNLISAKYKYGLFLSASYFRVLNNALLPDPTSKELLIAVATFSFPRIFNKDTNPLRSHELVRFASLRGTNVVGGLDKLLKAFERDKQPGDIMTYADIEWSAGASYDKLGFEKITQTQPGAFFINPENMQRFAKTETGESSVDYIEIRNMGSIKFVKTMLMEGTNAN